MPPMETANGEAAAGMDAIGGPENGVEAVEIRAAAEQVRDIGRFGLLSLR